MVYSFLDSTPTVATMDHTVSLRLFILVKVIIGASLEYFRCFSDHQMRPKMDLFMSEPSLSIMQLSDFWASDKKWKIIEIFIRPTQYIQ